jgi:hypothetical protein
MVCAEDNLPFYQASEYDRENSLLNSIEKIDLVLSVLLCFRKTLSFTDTVEICLKLLYHYTDSFVFKQIKSPAGKCARRVINLKIEHCCNFLLNYIALNFKELYTEQRRVSKKMYFETIEASVEECLGFFSSKLKNVTTEIVFSSKDLKNLLDKFEEINCLSRQLFVTGTNY